MRLDPPAERKPRGLPRPRAADRFKVPLKNLLARLARSRGPLRLLVGAHARRNRRQGHAGVAAVVVGEGRRVLLLEHVFWPERRWGLPGGWAKPEEAPADAIRRELREELDLDVSVERLLVEETAKGQRGYAFLCRPRGQTSLRLSLEILSARWFELDDLPELMEFHRRAITAASASEREDFDGGGRGDSRLPTPDS